jgi:hypothetical protein
MKIKLLLSVLFFLSCKIATAQWANQVVSPWVYNFTGGTSSTINTTSAAIDNTSSSGSPFLPAPPSGVSRVYAPTTTGSVFTLDKDANTLTMVPSSTSGVAKFSVYSVSNASPLVTVSITVNMGRVAAATPPSNLFTYSWYIGNRTATTNVFNNTSSGFNAAGAAKNLFTAMRLQYNSTNDNYIIGYRSAGGSSNTHINLTGGALSPDVKYKLEAFCNNSTVSKTYTKNTIVYTVPAGTFHLWVTNVTAGTTAVRYFTGVDTYDLPKSVEIVPAVVGPPAVASSDETMPADVNLNAFLFQAASNTSNVAKVTINGGMSLAYDLSTLPVSLTSFKGDLQNNEVSLNWRTASEQNNDYFEVLRAGEDKNFVAIAKIKGNGTKNEVSDYYYQDKSPLAGNNYYQLKQVDFDGKSTIHENVVVVKSGFATTSLAIMSNADNGLKVNIQADQKSKGTLTLFNINGQKVFEANVVLNQGFNEFNYQTLSIEKGVYIAKVSAGSLQLNKKFLKN